MNAESFILVRLFHTCSLGAGGNAIIVKHCCEIGKRYTDVESVYNLLKRISSTVWQFQVKNYELK